ncbi:hypothetical protein CENSYa_0678 [Cenarchaeum symbiosum A]|uniref:Uncharacterized protein n=1 Tax=Cenarchaeum symbiosum (strain A) TaxID=414004 RepID=A0RVE4_CENSY|nr:hypothetical protein CENSYa_0678 [Cenarchaeum symbiosum A]
MLGAHGKAGPLKMVVCRACILLGGKRPCMLCAVQGGKSGHGAQAPCCICVDAYCGVGGDIHGLCISHPRRGRVPSLILLEGTYVERILPVCAIGSALMRR